MSRDLYTQGLGIGLMKSTEMTEIQAYTSGPWKAVNAGSVREVISRDGRLIADVVMDDASIGFANSALIAAAPELLSALKKLQTAIVERDLWHGQEDELSAATHAIAKAEGRY